MAVKLIVNGKEVELADGSSAVALLTHFALPLDAQGVAIAVNREVVPRSQWQEQELKNGDEVDLVTAVQGG